MTGTVNVFAAASLQESFTTLGKQFEAAHPGVTVTSNFGAVLGSGATRSTRARPPTSSPRPARRTWTRSSSRRAQRRRHAFAKNVMEIAVPPANPAAIARPDRPGQAGRQGRAVPVRRCPCGSVAAKVFANAKITVTPVSQEADVKAVLTKVQLGEVDAGRRLRHRREGRRCQGQGHRDPGGRQRLDDLPDRRADQGAEPDRGPGVRRLRPVRRGRRPVLRGRAGSRHRTRRSRDAHDRPAHDGPAAPTVRATGGGPAARSPGRSPYRP